MSNFFSTVASFATPFAKAGVAKDPLAIARTKFATVADAQIKLLKEKKEGYWFKKQGDGFVLTLKNGATTLNAEHASFVVASVDDAVKFLEQAKEAAKAGEFDALFTATARKVKGKEGAEGGGAGDAGAGDAPAADADKKDEPAKGAAKGKKK